MTSPDPEQASDKDTPATPPQWLAGTMSGEPDRYWNGYGWTDATATPPTAGTGTAAGATHDSDASRAWPVRAWRRWRRHR
jgi:hypothetical protein